MIKFKRIESDVEKSFPQLVKCIAKESGVIAIYLFGSYAREATGPLSDVDIAVLLDEKIVEPESNTDLKLKLLSIASGVLKTDEIDIIVLNVSPVYLQYQIIKEGRLLFLKDKAKEQNFREQVVSNYLDTKKIRDEYFLYMQKSFMKGEVGNGYKSRKYKSALERAQRMYR